MGETTTALRAMCPVFVTHLRAGLTHTAGWPTNDRTDHLWRAISRV